MALDKPPAIDPIMDPPPSSGGSFFAILAGDIEHATKSAKTFVEVSALLKESAVETKKAVDDEVAAILAAKQKIIDWLAAHPTPAGQSGNQSFDQYGNPIGGGGSTGGTAGGSSNAALVAALNALKGPGQ
jgi:hypothetical protein